MRPDSGTLGCLIPSQGVLTLTSKPPATPLRPPGYLSVLRSSWPETISRPREALRGQTLAAGTDYPTKRRLHQLQGGRGLDGFSLSIDCSPTCQSPHKASDWSLRNLSKLLGLAFLMVRPQGNRLAEGRIGTGVLPTEGGNLSFLH